MRAVAALLCLLALTFVGCSDQDDGPGGRSEAGERTVRHALGTARAPDDVERLVILDATFTLGFATSLGVWPSAAMTEAPPGAPRFPPGLGERADRIQPLPGPEIDLEAVAAARPQLIVGETSYVEPAYDELAQIAPTIAVDFTYRPFEDLRRVAEALDVPRAAKSARRQVERALDRSRQRLGDCGTVSVTGARTDGTLRLYDPLGYFPVLAARRLGCELTPTFADVGAEPEPGAIADVSPERTSAFDGEHLFLVQDPGDREEQAQVRRLRGEPLFADLPAVRGGRVTELDQLDALGSAGVGGWLRTLERMTTALEGDR